MAVKAKASITISHLIDISSVTRYYLLQSSTATVPAKPTTNPPSSSWETTEPSYTSGSTNTLYFVDCTVFTNGTFKYSEVSKSSSYEAAKEAYNKAAAVETRVTNAETAINQNKEAITLRATKTEVTEAIGKIRVGGRNLLVGTGVPITHTGTGGTNQTKELYYLSEYYNKLPSLNGVDLTLSFDWETTATSGKFLIQLNSTPWTVLSNNIVISDSNKSGTSVYTFTANSGFDTGNYWALQLRSDNITGDVIIKNMMFELGNKPSSWQPAPEDIQFGGRNYILNSVFEKPMLDAYDSGASGWAHPIGETSATIDSTVTHNAHNTLHKQCTYADDDTWYESNYYFANNQCIQFNPNETWTLSLWIYAEVIPAEPLLSSIRLFNGNWTWAKKVCEIEIGDIVVTEVEKWTHVELSFNTPSTIPTYDRGYVMLTTNQTTNCYMTEFKLEKGKGTDWSPAPEDTDMNIEDASKDLQTIISDQNKSTLDSCNDSIDKALKNYVPVSDYEEYKKTVVTTSQLTQTSDDLKLDFQSRITETNNDMNTRFTELSKYFRFSDNGIEIGSEQNSLKLILDNELIRFEKNGESVGWWDGVDFHTGNIMVDVTERAQFGNFAFIPRDNGSLMLSLIHI